MTEFNNEIQNSQLGYDSTLAPGFRGYVDIERDNIDCDSIIPEAASCSNIALINKFIDLCPDREIQDFIINNNGVSREIYLGNWTFLSLQKIIDLDRTYRESGITGLVDLGYIYHGLGWIVVAFYYCKTGLVYFRMDGGSNCYDRKENFYRLKTLDTVMESVTSDRAIKFQDFLSIIRNDSELPNVVI